MEAFGLILGRKWPVDMGTEARRTYTPEEKTEALALYVEHGPAEASRKTGIPSQTIRKWAERTGKTRRRSDRAAANFEAARLTWAQRKAEIAMRSGDAAAEFIERALATSNAGAGQNWMRAYALAVDKAQLLDGGATDRVEVASAEEREQRVRELRDEVAARRKAKQAG